MMHCLRLKCLLVAIFLLAQNSLSRNICQWNSRKIITRSGYYKIMTLKPSDYSDGLINGEKFKSSTSFFFGRSCHINQQYFQCYDGKFYGLNVTVFELKNISGVDSVLINSTFPITLHRVKKPTISTKIPRFHLVESTQFNYCPKWDALNLTWTLIGDLNSTQNLTCFANKTKLCQGTTINATEALTKCVVSEGAGRMKFTMPVTRHNATRLSFYYCQLNATAGEIVTYVVDWLDSSPVPKEGIPPKIPRPRPTALPLLSCKNVDKWQAIF